MRSTSTSTACYCQLRTRVVRHSDGPEHTCRLGLQACIDANHRHSVACNHCQRPLRQAIYTCRHGRVVVTDCVCGYGRVSGRGAFGS